MGVWWSLRVSPPVSTSSPAPLSFLTQLRSETTQPTDSTARCWYKLNVIPSQGSVINYPPRLCCQDWAVSVSRFQSSFSPLPLSRQLSDLWRPAHHLDWITTKLGLNFLNISSVSIIRRVHLLFMRNICSILLPSFHFAFPLTVVSCVWYISFPHRPGPATSTRRYISFTPEFLSELACAPCALCASAHANSQPPAPLAELSLRDH